MSYGEILRGGPGWGRETLLKISAVDNDTTTVDIATEGTLDWWWMGNRTANAFAYALAVNDVHQKRRGLGHLFRGFQWDLGGAGTILTQTSSRTLQAAGSDNSTGITLNHSNRSGYFTNAGSLTNFIGRGFQLVIPAAIRARRLRMYTVQFQCGITTTARLEGINETVSKTVAAATTNHSVWTIDFAAGSAKLLVVQANVTEQIATNPNFQIQAFTLSEVS